MRYFRCTAGHAAFCSIGSVQRAPSPVRAAAAAPARTSAYKGSAATAAARAVRSHRSSHNTLSSLSFALLDVSSMTAIVLSPGCRYVPLVTASMMGVGNELMTRDDGGSSLLWMKIAEKQQR